MNDYKILVLLFLFSFVSHSVKGQRVLCPPIRKELKIEKIQKYARKLYFIYASSNDSLYKIVSYYDKNDKKGKKIKKGKTYNLWIQSLTDESIKEKPRKGPGTLSIPTFSSDSIPKQTISMEDLNVYGIPYGDYSIDTYIDESLVGLYDSWQLNGKRITDDPSLPKGFIGKYYDFHVFVLTPPEAKRILREGEQIFGYKGWYDNYSVIGLNIRYKHVPPQTRTYKIEKIQKAFDDEYIIHASCNDTLYRIISPVRRLSIDAKKGKKLRKGASYTLCTSSYQPLPTENIPALESQSGIRVVYGFKHLIKLEENEQLWNILTSLQLSGDRIIELDQN